MENREWSGGLIISRLPRNERIIIAQTAAAGMTLDAFSRIALLYAPYVCEAGERHSGIRIFRDSLPAIRD